MYNRMPASKDFRNSTLPLLVPMNVNTRWRSPVERYAIATNPDIPARIADVDQRTLFAYNGCIITQPAQSTRAFVLCPVRTNGSSVRVSLEVLAKNIATALTKIGEHSLALVREYTRSSGFGEEAYVSLIDNLERNGVDVYEYQL